MLKRLCVIVPLLFGVAVLFADGPADNIPGKVRPIPPLGVTVSKEDQDAIQKSLDEYWREIEAASKRADFGRFGPDFEVYHKAVKSALDLNEMRAGDVAAAKRVLAAILTEIRKYRQSKVGTWGSGVGLVIRGYRSRIDGDVQPYALRVPASWTPSSPRSYPLHVWLHGRGETLSELSFIDKVQQNAPNVLDPKAFVLYPYGRYCNAFKFAGEIDVLEAIKHVKKNYAIDGNRIVMNGFSMGGAGCWQFAVHYPDRWVAAAPGAGFSETPEFLKSFQKEKLNPTVWEKILWRMYDCPGYAGNLFNLPVIAYSGENDIQKQAADVMEKALLKEGIRLVHLIGPKMGHSYHPNSRKEINRRLNRLVTKGRNRVPPIVKFSTYTLRYNKSFWVRIEGMQQHWDKATVVAELTRGGVKAKTANVSHLSFVFDSGDCPIHIPGSPIIIDGQTVTGPRLLSDHSWVANFHKVNGKWQRWKAGTTLRKRPGLQGPIDDAFMDSFMILKPTGPSTNPKVAAWARAEMNRAILQWRKHFRGRPLVKDDKDVTAGDIAANNLILWGEPSSNKVLARILNRLPIDWTKKSVKLGKLTYGSATHVPVLIYPNPLNPRKYVVINSGFTYREYDYLNNARQVPKLPDFAIIDIRTSPGSQWPGKVEAAGFFTETWKLP